MNLEFIKKCAILAATWHVADLSSANRLFNLEIWSSNIKKYQS
jgi:hypothetical protein